MIRDRRLWQTIAAGVAVGLFAGVGFAVYALRVEEIRVTGVRTLEPRAVVQASGLRGGERILWIRLSVVARRLERLASISAVTVRRSLPNTVVIDVDERSPLARLGPDAQLAVDDEGRVFVAPRPAGLPVLEGWRGEARAGLSLDPVSRSVLRSFGEFPASLRARSRRVVVGPPLTLWLDDGTEVRFGRHNDLVRKASVANEILKATPGPLAYIDVRAPSLPVSRRRAPASPTPTGAPSAARPAATSPPPA